MTNVACGIILNYLNEVLVTQRSSKMHLPLKWEFPGGKVEAEESAEECLIREIKEELEIDIEILEKLAPNEHQYGEKRIKLMPFICRLQSGDIIRREHADHKWVKSKYLLDLEWAEADIPIVKNYLRVINGI